MFKIYLGIDPITNKQRHTTRRGFRTKADAKIAMAKIKTETHMNGLQSNEVTTFNELYDLWLESYQHTVKESTLNHVLAVFKIRVLPHFSNKKIKKITISYCQNVVNEWFNTYDNINNVVAYTKLLFQYAVKLKIINDNPFEHIQKPKKTNIDADELLYYTKDELKTFLSFCQPFTKEYAMFRVLAFTGIRKGELLALTWQDIDLFTKNISINKTVALGLNNKQIIQKPKTQSSYRKISIDDTTVKILVEWHKEQAIHMLKLGYNTKQDNQLVFSNTKNRLLSSNYLMTFMRNICKKNNYKKIKIHGFRHTHCSLLFESGASIQEVQNRLGHSNIQTTMKIYAHVTETQKENIATRFQNYIGF